MRYPPIEFRDMNFEQKRAVRLVSQRRKPSVSSEGGVEGPFVPLVYIPGILDRLQALGEHCRFRTSLPPQLRELAIIITARHVAAPLEFHVHAMEAHEFGMAQSIIDAVANQQRPLEMSKDVELVYDFCMAYHTEGRVPDALFDAFSQHFSATMAIELMTTCGYYGTLGLSMNVSHPAVPKFLAGFKPAFSVPTE